MNCVGGTNSGGTGSAGIVNIKHDCIGNRVLNMVKTKHICSYH